MSVDPDVRSRAATHIPPKPASHPVPWPNIERYPHRSFALVTALWLHLTVILSLAAANLSGTVRTAVWVSIALVPAVPVVAVCIAIAALVRRSLRRARVRAAADRAGCLSAEIDWTSDRTHALTVFPLRTVPPRVGVAGTVGIACVGTFALATRHPAAAWLVLAAGVVAYAVFLAWFVARGAVQVRFDRFPYVVGQRATFWVAMTAGSPRLEHARYLLRCAEPDRFSLQLLTTPVVTLWEDCFAAPPEQWPGPEEYVEVTFDIPAGLVPGGLPGTSLHGDPVVRWELLVLGRTRWGRLTETFIVPVYAAPA